MQFLLGKFAIRPTFMPVKMSRKNVINFSRLKSFNDRLANRKKLIKEQKGYSHWHCKHIIFSVSYNFSKRAK